MRVWKNPWALVIAIMAGVVWFTRAAEPASTFITDTSRTISPLSMSVPPDLEVVNTDGAYHFGIVR